MVQQAYNFDGALPAPKPLLPLLSGLNQLATDHQVTLSDVQTRPGNISTQSAEVAVSGRTTSKSTSKAKAYEELSITMSLAGGLQNINDFLAAVERMAPLTNVTKLSLSEARGRNAAADSFTAEVDMTTYYYTQSVKQAITAALPQLTSSATTALEELSGFTYNSFSVSDEIQGSGSINPFGTE